MTIAADCEATRATATTLTTASTAEAMEPQWAAALEEKIKGFPPSAQAAVRKYWGSVVMRTQRAFSEENGATNLAEQRPALPIDLRIYESDEGRLNAICAPAQRQQPALGGAELRTWKSLDDATRQHIELRIYEANEDAKAWQGEEEVAPEEEQLGADMPTTWNRPNAQCADERKTWKSFDEVAADTHSAWWQRSRALRPLHAIERDLQQLKARPSHGYAHNPLRKSKSLVEQRRAKQEELSSVKMFQQQHLQRVHWQQHLAQQLEEEEEAQGALAADTIDAGALPSEPPCRSHIERTASASSLPVVLEEEEGNCSSTPVSPGDEPIGRDECGIWRDDVVPLGCLQIDTHLEATPAAYGEGAAVASSPRPSPVESGIEMEVDDEEEEVEVENSTSGDADSPEVRVEFLLGELLDNFNRILSERVAAAAGGRRRADEVASRRRLLTPTTLPPFNSPLNATTTNSSNAGLNGGGGGGGVGAPLAGSAAVGGGVGGGTVRSCHCCPYGYHIDLDFVRYCEALANAKPSEDELRRRDRRRSRKSMEFMLGLESLFDQWEAAERVQAVPEAAHESEPDSPAQHSNALAYGSFAPQRPRSASVPRFTYNGGARAESPFGTASSTCSSLRGGVESDAAYYPLRRPAISPPEQRAFLRDALDEVCSDFERTLERTSSRRRRNAPLVYGGVVERTPNSDRNNNNNSHSKSKPLLVNGWSHTVGAAAGGPAQQRNGLTSWNAPLPPPLYRDFDSCVAGNKSPRSSRSFTRSNTLPFQRKPSPAEQQYELYVQAKVVENAKSPVEQQLAILQTPQQQQPPPPPPPPRRHAAKLLSPSAGSASSNQDFATPVATAASTPSTLLSPISLPDAGAGGSAAANTSDAQMLCNIREQMALSLKRMKDLEEQVRNIPELQGELTRLRDENQQLAHKLQRREEELQRSKERDRDSGTSQSSSPSPVVGRPFAPQRISPISLESLGARLHQSSTASVNSSMTTSATTTLERREQRAGSLKRDVGTMCGLRQASRDVAVGSPIITLRSIGTNPLQTLHIAELLYTRLERDEHTRVSIESYEELRKQQQLKRLTSVGTQMFTPQRETRDTQMQTSPERAVLKYAVGVMVRPQMRDNFVSCKPDVRSIGTSDDRTTDVLCAKCACSKRSVASATDEVLAPQPPPQPEPTSRAAVSLKLLEMPGRSATFSLGEHERLNLAARKTIGTQCTTAVLHSAGSQTAAAALHSVSVQHQPATQNVGTQSQADSAHRQTDTRDLIRLCATQTNTEEIASPAPPTPPPVVAPPAVAKPPTRTTGSNTEAPLKRSAVGVNTDEPAAIRHSACNTEEVRKRDIACGDIVKPHISIACADNYCDSCKEAIRHLAKDFTKLPSSPLLSRANSLAGSVGGGNGNGIAGTAIATDSRIPRPKHLTSPSPARKQFQRQNTYTITPSPTPSPVAEKRNLASSLHEKPPAIGSFHALEASAETQNFITEPTIAAGAEKSSTAVTRRPPAGSPNKSKQRSAGEAAPLEVVPQESPSSPEAYDLTHATVGDLIVREETRVSISWSRDASPASLPRKSLENSFNEKLQEELEAATTTAATDSSKGARKKTSPSPPKSSQHEREEPTSVAAKLEASVKPPTKALLQKLAMVEAAPRTKISPAKEMLGALKIINDSLLKRIDAKSFSSSSLKGAKLAIQQDWFRISSTEKANPHEVEDYLDCFEAMSVPLLEYCVNIVDNNGNTAMHYAVSHGNFDVVSILLDSKVCNVNQMNNAGYTSVMLVSLAKLKNPAHRTVVERLFQMADVNIRAKKHCQTALMLAVSHGNSDMVEMLLAAGADINIQDEDGSTALMCAAEHGRIEIVKHLLSQADCDSLIQDMDGSTAFKIAWQAGHRDIALLLYVHEQMLRSKLPNRGGESPRTPSLSPRQHKRQPSQ